MLHYNDEFASCCFNAIISSRKCFFICKTILDLNIEEARTTLSNVSEKYPIVLTRDLTKAKKWLKEKARGSERYGMVVSSQAQRLKPYAIDVKSPMDPVNWFLMEKKMSVLLLSRRCCN